jgi:hypothetical protein
MASYEGRHPAWEKVLRGRGERRRQPGHEQELDIVIT